MMMDIESQIRAMFKPLTKVRDNYPERGILAKELTLLVSGNSSALIPVTNKVMQFYASAAIEMWERSVHSFLISAAVSASSPIWASVAGYYSSHYAVRAFAHLLGYFQLRKLKKIVRITNNNSKLYFEVIAKNASDREHKAYWKIVKSSSALLSDPLFTLNEDDESVAESDSGHRNIANYVDHVDGFPEFRVLDEVYLKERVKRLSEFELASAPIPRRGRFPDLDSVQLIAYHRFARFRGYLDGILGLSNLFWKTRRNPAWCSGYLLFPSPPASPLSRVAQSV
jgi:hypothetical protein